VVVEAVTATLAYAQTLWDIALRWLPTARVRIRLLAEHRIEVQTDRGGSADRPAPTGPLRIHLDLTCAQVATSGPVLGSPRAIINHLYIRSLPQADRLRLSCTRKVQTSLIARRFALLILSLTPSRAIALFA
jgi:hypothetical protein